jgi:dihydroorotase
MIASSTVQRDNRPKRLVNARLFCPKSGLDEPGGLMIEDGLIADKGPHIRQPGGEDDVETIDCGGHLLIPGLIDMQVSTG